MRTALIVNAAGMGCQPEFSAGVSLGLKWPEISGTHSAASHSHNWVLSE